MRCFIDIVLRVLGVRVLLMFVVFGDGAWCCVGVDGVGAGIGENVDVWCSCWC